MHLVFGCFWAEIPTQPTTPREASEMLYCKHFLGCVAIWEPHVDNYPNAVCSIYLFVFGI